ncbi:hypothetical protein ACN28I_23980 [Archangium gephyra]|uniref:hypothetical protein n=1 Tax=Archangium gephyra TaxID=48 RepID=UPI003B7D743F
MDADTREALAQRIELATPEEQISGIFCENTFLAIRELLGRQQADAVRSSTWPLRPWVSVQRYPVADLLRMVGSAADLAEKQGLLSYTQALEEPRRLGHPHHPGHTVQQGRSPGRGQ